MHADRQTDRQTRSSQYSVIVETVCSEKSESRQSTLHHPHPNIIDELRGTIASDVRAAAAADSVVVANGNGDGSDATAAAATNSDVDDDPVMPAAAISLDNVTSEQCQIRL